MQFLKADKNLLFLVEWLWFIACTKYELQRGVGSTGGENVDVINVAHGRENAIKQLETRKPRDDLALLYKVSLPNFNFNIASL